MQIAFVTAIPEAAEVVERHRSGKGVVGFALVQVFGGFATVSFWRWCCSVGRSKMRHLVCVCLHEGRAGRGARNIVTTGGIFRQPVEPIDKTQHIRHEDVGDGEGPGQPFASCQHRLQVLEPGLEERVQTLPFRRITGVTRERP
jgi:hypothetical protein